MSLIGRTFRLNDELNLNEIIAAVGVSDLSQAPSPTTDVFFTFTDFNNIENKCYMMMISPMIDVYQLSYRAFEPSTNTRTTYTVYDTSTGWHADHWKTITFMKDPVQVNLGDGTLTYTTQQLEDWLALNATEILPEPEPEPEPTPAPTPTPKQETRYIMTKRGNQDNVVTYEFVCDTTADLAKIEPKYVTMGSVAIVIQGDSGFEVYMANSQKEWINLGSMGGSSTNSGPSSNVVGEGEAGSMIIHDGDTSAPTVDVGQADSMVLGE